MIRVTALELPSEGGPDVSTGASAVIRRDSCWETAFVVVHRASEGAAASRVVTGNKYKEMLRIGIPACAKQLIFQHHTEIGKIITSNYH